MDIPITPELIAALVTTIMTLLAALGGAKWKKYKKLAIEFGEALYVTTDAIKDDTVTVDEAKRLIKEWEEVIELAKELFED